MVAFWANLRELLTHWSLLAHACSPIEAFSRLFEEINSLPAQSEGPVVMVDGATSFSGSDHIGSVWFDSVKKCILVFLLGRCQPARLFRLPFLRPHLYHKIECSQHHGKNNSGIGLIIHGLIILSPPPSRGVRYFYAPCEKL